MNRAEALRLLRTHSDGTARGVITGIEAIAEQQVADTTPAAALTTTAWNQAVNDTARSITHRLVQLNEEQGRHDLARKIRKAWHEKHD